LELIEGEMKKLRADRLSARQLQSIKRQWSGNMALAQENRSSLANGLAKSLFLYGQIDATAEVQRRVEQVSAEQMLECAREVMQPSSQLLLHYQAEASS
jgi:predicted Zn-dependent peptidase